MSDELTPVEVATRKAFRAFYGNDDPVQFTDLTKEQRQRFEAVALSFQDKKEGTEFERFIAELSTLHERVAEFLASLVTGKTGASLVEAIMSKEHAEAFDILAKPIWKEICDLQEHYERRIPHR